MNPDLLAACLAWLRDQPTIVAAFGEDLLATPPVIKFWTDYAGQVAPPYLVFMEPQDRESFETVDAGWNVSSVSDGIMTVEVFAGSKATAEQLAIQVGKALNDADLAFEGGGVMLFRRTGHVFPIITNTGPDGNPATFSRRVAFRFLVEHNRLETI